MWHERKFQHSRRKVRDLYQDCIDLHSQFDYVTLWYLITGAVWSFLLPRLCSSNRDVPPTEELHSEPWGWLLLRLCGCSWNRPRVSKGVTMKAPAVSHRILVQLSRYFCAITVVCNYRQSAFEAVWRLVCSPCVWMSLSVALLCCTVWPLPHILQKWSQNDNDVIWSPSIIRAAVFSSHPFACMIVSRAQLSIMMSRLIFWP